MKRIGTTDDGNMIIEISPKEWECLNRNSVMSIADDLPAWKKDFLGKIWKLELSTRATNAILRGAVIHASGPSDTIEYNLENPPNARVFKEFGKLLPFDLWCEAVLEGRVNCQEMRQFGKGLDSELKLSIRCYLDNYSCGNDIGSRVGA